MISKTIFITGSGSGLGKASALYLAQRGHRVIATTHHEGDAEQLNTLAKKSNLPLESFMLDITKSQDREKILDYDIDVLINNAGIGETGSLAEVSIDKVRNNFEVNLFSTLELSQLALRQMIKKDAGTVIFISSVLGRITSPFFGPYSMTKFALSSGAEMLRQELSEISDNIKISVIEPGAYSTGFNQKMMATKYEWMDETSYFYKLIGKMKDRETRQFEKIEQKKLSSIVNKIVLVAESEKPKLRYVAPWWLDIGVRLLRALGK